MLQFSSQSQYLQLSRNQPIYYFVLSIVLLSCLAKKPNKNENKFVPGPVPTADWWIPAQNCYLEDNPELKEFAIYKICSRGNKSIDNIRTRKAEDYFRKLDLNNTIHASFSKKGEPMIITSPYGTSLFCAVAKSGSTAWKRVVWRVMGGTVDEYMSGGGTVHFMNFTALGDESEEDQKDLLQSKDVVRWVVVRNPYARLYSAYREKFVEGTMTARHIFHQRFNISFDNEVSVSFEEFVKTLHWHYLVPPPHRTLYPRRERSLSLSNGIDPHFAWQTSYCGMQQGLGQDYVLKSELITEWYPQLIKVLNYTEFVMSGWPGETDCFMSVPKLQCNGPELKQPLVGILQKQNSTQDTLVEENNQGSQTLHTRGSNALMLDAYNQDIARMATEIYWMDLVNLQYPIWDGKPENFRIV